MQCPSATSSTRRTYYPSSSVDASSELEAGTTSSTSKGAVLVLDIEFQNSPELDMLCKSDAVSDSYEFYQKNMLAIVVNRAF